MSRRKNAPTSAALQVQIEALEAARLRAEAVEDQRRGALMREYLRGPRGEAIRDILRPVVAPRESYLFGLESRRHDGEMHGPDGVP